MREGIDTRSICVIQSAIFSYHKMGIAICYDNRFQLIIGERTVIAVFVYLGQRSRQRDRCSSKSFEGITVKACHTFT